MYLAVDIGGTKVLLASFDENGATKSMKRFATPDTYAEFLEKFKTILPSLGQNNYKFAGVAIPGAVDRKNGVGLKFGNLSWQNVPIKKDLEDIVGAPVSLENDAKAAGLYEALNVINDFKKVLYVTIGTGIGIAVIIDDVIDTTINDLGGNIYMVNYSGVEQPWESFASGSVIKKRFGKKASDITDVSAWQEIASNIAVGLAQLINENRPDAVIIGGGAAKHFERYGELLKNYLPNQLSNGVNMPAILPAKRPEEAVIYGCFELAKTSYERAD